MKRNQLSSNQHLPNSKMSSIMILKCTNSKPNKFNAILHQYNLLPLKQKNTIEIKQNLYDIRKKKKKKVHLEERNHILDIFSCKKPTIEDNFTSVGLNL